MLNLTSVVFVLAAATVVLAVPFERELNLPNKYKVRRSTKHFGMPAARTETLMDFKGPGCITHIWMTTAENDYRRLILRMYWDGETLPSVEAPITDFFGIGHNHGTGKRDTPYFSTPCLATAPRNGLNCYFPMPFARSAKITLTNEQDEGVKGGVYFQADYKTFDALPDDTPYFHAQWRRESPALRRARPYTILQAVGKGFLAGMTYHIRIEDKADSWYHGGGDMVYIDGESDPYFINGIGGEDYFGASWGIGPFVSPYTGCTYSDSRYDEKDGHIAMATRGCVSMYRFYLEGPLRFDESVRLAFGVMANEITSVGYWYQTEPHQRFFRFPEAPLRDPASELEPGSHDIELLSDQQLNVAVIGPFAGGIDDAFTPQQQIDLSQSLKTNWDKPYKTDKPGDDDRQVRWERARTTLSWLDYAALYKAKMAGPRSVQRFERTVAYTYLRLHADGPRTCKMLLGHDDPAQLWLNGQKIADLPNSEGFCGRNVSLNLHDGWNDLLIKATNNSNENWYAFAVSLSFPDRQGIRFDDFTNLPPAEEYARPSSD